jgi:Fe-S cluster assembly protein SufD
MVKEYSINVHRLFTSKSNIFSCNLFILEEQSSIEVNEYFEFIDDFNTNCSTGTLFVMSDYYLNNYSKLKHACIKNLNHTSIVHDLNFFLNFKSTLNSLELNYKSNLNYTNKKICLYGAYSTADIKSLNLLTSGSKSISNVKQVHISSNSRSRIYQKNILLNNSETYFKGLILVDKKSSSSESSQLNKNTSLTLGNIVYSMPTIEILNKNVKCSHGSTTGSISPEEFFYMSSRGLNLLKIIKIFIFSFIHDIISTLVDFRNVSFINMLYSSTQNLI